MNCADISHSSDLGSSRALQHIDYLSFDDIAAQYPGCVTAGTLAVWASTHRYNFHRIVTKIGRNSRVRRDRWEQFLDSRTDMCIAESSYPSAEPEKGAR